VKRGIITVLFAALLAIASGCTNNSGTKNNDTSELESKIQEQEQTIERLRSENQELTEKVKTSEERKNPQLPDTVLNRALRVAYALKNKDMESLASYIHPEKGVRFSPYGYVNTKSDLVFTAKQIRGLLNNNTTYRWGAYDGTGEPIELTFADYYKKFVYDVDFANPHMIGNNVVVGKGNSLNNISQAYPSSVFIEFHFTGFDPQYEGMDWRSLRLVFGKSNNTWYLTGIVHDQWTS